MLLQIGNLSTKLIGPIDLCLEAGECVAIMGASGSGKSLFLRAIADLDPNSGDLSLNERNRDVIPANDWRSRVAMVPAESGWWTDRVGDHFDLETGAGPLLDKIGLPHALDWQVMRLSTGERHRLAIARALVLKPQVLLLDEPTAALDEPATAMIEQLMREQLDNGVAILLVTHDRQQAVRMAIRTHIMVRGQFASPDRGAA
uniref:ABC transporter, ATP-binding protein n=1 Tax=uncultured bacterium ws406H10 TaxID=1131831 RepID=I1X5H0_9BACT|nr:ABC transporter, ATP-binding protein [uncultured bacterium ws406H10]